MLRASLQANRLGSRRGRLLSTRVRPCWRFVRPRAARSLSPRKTLPPLLSALAQSGATPETNCLPETTKKFQTNLPKKKKTNFFRQFIGCFQMNNFFFFLFAQGSLKLNTACWIEGGQA